MSTPDASRCGDPEPKLPVNTDLDTAEPGARRSSPAHLSLAHVGLVAVGGAIGTGLRYFIGTSLPHWAGIPVATFGINVVGAFLLGLLLELLADHSHDIGWARRLRLGVGTGGLGGFTTYSALATDTVILGATYPGRAAGYALATVIFGGAASIAGIWLSRRHLRPRWSRG